MDQDRAKAAQFTHEESKLKQDVVAQGVMPLAAALDNVVRLSDRDGKVGFAHRLLESFEGVSTCKEYALVQMVLNTSRCSAVCISRAMGKASLEEMMKQLGILVGRRDKNRCAGGAAVKALARSVARCAGSLPNALKSGLRTLRTTSVSCAMMAAERFFALAGCVCGAFLRVCRHAV
jgi:hypothetical protein